jgi:hypothetical protein
MTKKLTKAEKLVNEQMLAMTSVLAALNIMLFGLRQVLHL